MVKVVASTDRCESAKQSWHVFRREEGEVLLLLNSNACTRIYAGSVFVRAVLPLLGVSPTFPLSLVLKSPASF